MNEKYIVMVAFFFFILGAVIGSIWLFPQDSVTGTLPISPEEIEEEQEEVYYIPYSKEQHMLAIAKTVTAGQDKICTTICQQKFDLNGMVIGGTFLSFDYFTCSCGTGNVGYLELPHLHVCKKTKEIDLMFLEEDMNKIRCKEIQE